MGLDALSKFGFFKSILVWIVMAKTLLWITFSSFGYIKDSKDAVTKIQQERLKRKNKRK